MGVQIVYVAQPTDEPYSRLFRYPDRPPIAVVKMDDGRLSVDATDPIVLLRIAKCFEKAAEMLADEALETADLEVRGA